MGGRSKPSALVRRALATRWGGINLSGFIGGNCHEPAASCRSSRLLYLDSLRPRASQTNHEQRRAFDEKTGLREQTIVLAIEQGPCRFDTSPQALVDLKKAGVSDAVSNAMLATVKKSSPESAGATTVTSSPIDAPNNLATALNLGEKALSAVARKETFLQSSLAGFSFQQLRKPLGLNCHIQV